MSGILFCAHCGGRLTANTYHDSYTRKDGITKVCEYRRYICYHKSRKLCKCDGQSTYSADKVDSTVYKVMSDIFSCVTNAPDENDLKRRFDKEISGSRAKQTKLRMEIQKYENQIERLNSEIASSLTGESVYTPEQLSAAIKSVNEKTTSAKAELETIIDSIENKKAAIEKVMICPLSSRQSKKAKNIRFDEGAVKKQQSNSRDFLLMGNLGYFNGIFQKLTITD